MDFKIIWSEFAENQIDEIYKKCQIIYSVDQENIFIKIADVFDTRQNPIKIHRTE